MDCSKLELLSAIILSGFVAKNNNETTDETVRAAIHAARDLITLVEEVESK